MSDNSSSSFERNFLSKVASFFIPSFSESKINEIDIEVEELREISEEGEKYIYNKTVTFKNSNYDTQFYKESLQERGFQTVEEREDDEIFSSEIYNKRPIVLVPVNIPKRKKHDIDGGSDDDDEFIDGSYSSSLSSSSSFISEPEHPHDVDHNQRMKESFEERYKVHSKLQKINDEKTDKQVVEEENAFVSFWNNIFKGKVQKESINENKMENTSSNLSESIKDAVGYRPRSNSLHQYSERIKNDKEGEEKKGKEDEKEKTSIEEQNRRCTKQ